MMDAINAYSPVILSAQIALKGFVLNVKLGMKYLIRNVRESVVMEYN